eukprot:2776746-Pyramimonas_sp.AAC.1
MMMMMVRRRRRRKRRRRRSRFQSTACSRGPSLPNSCRFAYPRQPIQKRLPGESVNQGRLEARAGVTAGAAGDAAAGAAA